MWWEVGIWCVHAPSFWKTVFCFSKSSLRPKICHLRTSNVLDIGRLGVVCLRGFYGILRLFLRHSVWGVRSQVQQFEGIDGVSKLVGAALSARGDPFGVASTPASRPQNGGFAKTNCFFLTTKSPS